MATTTISGTTDVEDTWIFEPTSEIPSSPGDKNFGATTNASGYTKIGSDFTEGQAFIGRGLIRCSAASIPSGAVTGFRIGFRYTAFTTGKTKSMYRVKDANTWVEGTASDVAQTGSSCWNKRIYNTTNWAGTAGLSTSGTDYYTGAATITSGTVGAYNEITLTSSWASDWRDAVVAANGLLLFGPEDGTGQMSWYSTEDASNQPYWEVDYTAAGGGISAFVSRRNGFGIRGVRGR